MRPLGRVATYHQTDNSTAATHNLAGGMRAFHEEYVEFMRELGMEPRTITFDHGETEIWVAGQ